MSDAPHEDDPPEDTVAVASRAAAVLGGLFALGGLGLYGPRTAASVLVGAVIAVANILTMRVIIRSLIQAPPDEEAPPGNAGNPPRSDAPAAEAVPERGSEAESEPDPTADTPVSRRASAMWGVFAALKMLIVFGGIWILLTRRVVDPMPLLVGYGAMPLGIVVGALWPSLGKRR